MRFLVDANLPPGLAAWLCDQGHDATHVSRELNSSTSDRAVMELARLMNAVVVSKHEDFVMIAVLDPDASQVVWIRLGNATNACLRNWIQPRLAEILHLLEKGERVVEVV